METIKAIEKELKQLLGNNYTLKDDNGSITFYYRNHAVSAMDIFHTIERKHSVDAKKKFATGILRHKNSLILGS